MGLEFDRLQSRGQVRNQLDTLDCGQIERGQNFGTGSDATGDGARNRHQIKDNQSVRRGTSPLSWPDLYRLRGSDK